MPPTAILDQKHNRETPPGLYNIYNTNNIIFNINTINYSKNNNIYKTNNTIFYINTFNYSKNNIIYNMNNIIFNINTISYNNIYNTNNTIFYYINSFNYEKKLIKIFKILILKIIKFKIFRIQIIISLDVVAEPDPRILGPAAHLDSRSVGLVRQPHPLFFLKCFESGLARPNTIFGSYRSVGPNDVGSFWKCFGPGLEARPNSVGTIFHARPSSFWQMTRSKE